MFHQSVSIEKFAPHIPLPQDPYLQKYYLSLYDERHQHWKKLKVNYFLSVQQASVPNGAHITYHHPKKTVSPNAKQEEEAIVYAEYTVMCFDKNLSSMEILKCQLP